jgi:MOSC domain-containing protein YiiM
MPVDPAAGRVVSLHVKPEVAGERGLPKPTIPAARFTVGGLSGDFNRYRHEEKHDDPRMAVLLFPIETVREFNREGWPVQPGDFGENVTTEGIPYAAFAPGSRWRIGTARVEITQPCDPCDTLFQLPYVGSARGPEFLKTALARRGWYARVIADGAARAGDPIARDD